jgi:hypothetical protein
MSDLDWTGQDWTGDEEGNNRIEKETKTKSKLSTGWVSLCRCFVSLWDGLEPNKKKGALDHTGWARLAWAELVLERKSFKSGSKKNKMGGAGCC